MFEKLVSGDEAKATRIKAVIDRYVQSQSEEIVEESEPEDNGEWKDFDMRLFIGKTMK
jgi:hypothetical protein